MPQQKATATKLATDGLSATSTDADDGIIQRIQKCLDRANHTNTTEAEGKAALFLSSKLMGQYNVTTADLLAKENAANLVQHTGDSYVTIRSTKGAGHRVMFQSFVQSVALAMRKAYDCKVYSTRRRDNEIRWTFYGIAKNTVAAAMAFEMVHNKILDWACAHTGVSATYSYCNGVADGLISMANKQKDKETREARKKEKEALVAREAAEKLQRKGELERLNGPPKDASSTSMSDFEVEPRPVQCSVEEDNAGLLTNSLVFDDESDILSGYSSENEEFFDCYSEIDGMDDSNDGNDGGEDTPEAELEPDFHADDGEFLDPTADLDEQIRIVLGPKTPLPVGSTQDEPQHIIEPKKITDQNVNNIPCWHSEMQLVRFRETAAQLADDFLKSNNIKLYSGSSRKATIKDRRAYLQGKQDSKKIDLGQNSIE